MNWLVIATILVLAYGIVRGYRTGLLLAIFSMVSWIVVLAFVILASPRVATYINENTQIPTRIEEKCAKEIRRAVTKEVDKQTEDFAEEHQITEEGMEKLGFLVPAVMLNRVMEKNGTYDTLAKSMAESAVNGLAYLITLVVALVMCELLKRIFKGVSKVPLLGKVNRKLGVLVGAVKGLLDVWIVFGLTAAFAGTAWGQFMISYIYDSPFLVLLYEQNLLVDTVLYFV